MRPNATNLQTRFAVQYPQQCQWRALQNPSFVRRYCPQTDRIIRDQFMAHEPRGQQAHFEELNLGRRPNQREIPLPSLESFSAIRFSPVVVHPSSDLSTFKPLPEVVILPDVGSRTMPSFHLPWVPPVQLDDTLVPAGVWMVAKPLDPPVNPRIRNRFFSRIKKWVPLFANRSKSRYSDKYPDQGSRIDPRTKGSFRGIFRFCVLLLILLGIEAILVKWSLFS